MEGWWMIERLILILEHWPDHSSQDGWAFRSSPHGEQLGDNSWGVFNKCCSSSGKHRPNVCSYYGGHYLLPAGASLTFSLMDTNPHRYPFLFKGWIWDARSRLGPVEKHNQHPHQEFWGPLLRGCLLLPRWLRSCLQRGQRLGGRQLVAQRD